jgi:hypothetical protein
MHWEQLLTLFLRPQAKNGLRITQDVNCAANNNAASYAPKKHNAPRQCNQAKDSNF